MYIPIVLNQVPASHPLRAVHHQFVTDLNMLLPSQSDRLGSGERTGLRSTKSMATRLASTLGRSQSNPIRLPTVLPEPIFFFDSLETLALLVLK